MKIEKIRIKNFKSIIDSGDIYLEPDLTILAGKNESGKTSVLEALITFNSEVKFEKEYVPFFTTQDTTLITITFVLNKDDIYSYFQRCRKTKAKEEVPEYHILTITKKSGGIYEIDELSKAKLEFLNSYLVYEDLENLPDRINEEIDKLNILYEHATDYKLRFPKFKKNDPDAKILVALIQDNLKYAHPLKIDVRDSLRKLLFNLNDSISHYQKLHFTWQPLFHIVPHFILYKSFEDNIPDEFPINQATKNPVGRFAMSKLGFHSFSFLSKDERLKIVNRNKVNITLKENYLKNWSQDKTHIQIENSGENATIWIKENEEFFKPSQRSKGKQWHLSFFFSIEGNNQVGKATIILIDEPGLYLHAKAQEDIYNNLLDLSQKGQIIFSTHSPYLMNGDEIHRIRLIQKHTIEEGTKVNGSLIFKSDKETLTPIFTAIGISLNQGIVSLNKKYNVVVEGLSDYFYLNIFKRIFTLDNINFISGGGSGNMGNIGAILSGWGTEVLYLFDKDQGGKDGIKKLKDWSIDREYILNVYDENQAIEDMFSKNDFKKYLLKDDSLTINSSNSDYLKAHKIKKIIVSKQFYNEFNKENHTQFDEETMTNFKGLLEKISLVFQNI